MESGTLASDAWAVLRIPFVRTFALGRIASVLGIQIISTAVGWELYERTHNAWSLALVGVFELLPVLVLVLPAGSVIDLFPRRHIAVLAHLVFTLAGCGLVAVSALHGPIALIYALLTVVGAARAFGSPAVATLLPQLLPSHQYAQANAWLSSSFELASIVGPALAGFLIAMRGDATLAYVAGALGEATFVALLFTLPLKPPPPEKKSKRTVADMFAGFAFIRRNPVFLAAITLDLFAVLLGGATALLPMFAKDVLHVGPTGLGWLRAAPAAGAMLMALLTTRLPAWKKPGRTLLWVVAGFGLATIGFGLSTSFPLSLACLFFTGVFDNISVVIRLTLEQVLTPDALRGRVSSVHFVFIGFSNELGGFESGATAALFGPVASVVGGGIGTIAIVALVALGWPVLARLHPLHTLTALSEPNDSL